jgi:acetamidase/formamidase
MTTFRLNASPENIRISSFSADYAPVLRIESGDSVEIECISGRSDVLPPSENGCHIPTSLAQALARFPDLRPGHILTGPIAVEGAMPGDMLEVRIDSITPGADWGYCGMRPLSGSLPNEFAQAETFHISVDKEAGTCRLPWGTELPLSPFLGIMGVAPPASYGTIRSTEPRCHGGNMDNTELTAGSTLFLPVWHPGANFVAGDGHGRQGDGEVCVNGLEMCLDATLTFKLHKASGDSGPMLRLPRADTPTHVITMGFHASLDEALKIALREMINYICGRSQRSRAEAYALCSLAVDFRVTQSVNGEKGIHGMLKKSISL